MTDNKTFSTTDLYLAAFLQAAGVEMSRTERDPKNKVTFVFSDTLGAVAGLKAGWSARTAKIHAQPYADCIKNLKRLCHAER